MSLFKFLGQPLVFLAFLCNGIQAQTLADIFSTGLMVRGTTTTLLS